MPPGRTTRRTLPSHSLSWSSAIKGAELLQPSAMLFRENRRLIVSSDQGSQMSARLRRGPKPVEGLSISLNGLLPVAALFVELPKVVAYFSMLSQKPGGGDIFLRFVQITAPVVHPAQGIPISDERGH